MHVEMWLTLTRLCTIILKYVHPMGTKGLSSRMRDVPRKTVHAFYLPALDV
jgi:hypothetical protein